MSSWIRTTVATASSLLVVLLVAHTSHAAGDGGGKRRTISVNGRGEVSANPDLAILSFAVETTAATAATAVEQNAAVSTKVGAALKSVLGQGDKLKTTRYSLQPRYETKREPGEAKIVGYVASNEVQVETAAVDGVGKLIDTATTAGANRVSNLTFTVKDRNRYVREALDLAGNEAKAQAEAAARALGVKLKQVVSASTLAPPIIQPRVFGGFGRAAMAQATTPVEAGDVTVTAELSVTYEIE